MSVDRIDSGPKNSLYVRVSFEHSQGKEAMHTLINSGMTKNFVNKQMAERWGLPRRTLPNPRLITNVDGTENKAGAVTKACILNVLYQGNQQLQWFYITDLGFDRVLLGYPWLHEFNPQVDWKGEGVVGEITLQTVANAWERWRDLRKKALVASIQVKSATVDETEIRKDMCTMCVTTFPFIVAYCTIVDSYRTCGLLTHHAYLYSDCFLIAVSFLVRPLLTNDSYLFVLVETPFDHVCRPSCI